MPFDSNLNLASAPSLDQVSAGGPLSNTPAEAAAASQSSATPGGVDIDKLIADEGATKYAPFIKAIYSQESGGNALSRPSVDGAQGGMQVMPATYSSVMGNAPKTPENMVRAGIRVASQLGDQFNGNTKAMAAGYFSGPGNAVDNGQGYVKDYHDGNGKLVSEYVDNVQQRLSTGSSTPQPTQPPAPDGSAPAAAAPAASSNGPMKWAQVVQTPDYQNADTPTREAMRQQYFEDVVAPQIPTEQLAQVKQAYDADTIPTLMDKAKDVAK